MAKEILVSIDVDGNVTADGEIGSIQGDVYVEDASGNRTSLLDQEILYWMGLS